MDKTETVTLNKQKMNNFCKELIENKYSPYIILDKIEKIKILSDKEKNNFINYILPNVQLKYYKSKINKSGYIVFYYTYHDEIKVSKLCFLNCKLSIKDISDKNVIVNLHSLANISPCLNLLLIKSFKALDSLNKVTIDKMFIKDKRLEEFNSTLCENADYIINKHIGLVKYPHFKLHEKEFNINIIFENDNMVHVFKIMDNDINTLLSYNKENKEFDTIQTVLKWLDKNANKTYCYALPYKTTTIVKTLPDMEIEIEDFKSFDQTKIKNFINKKKVLVMNTYFKGKYVYKFENNDNASNIYESLDYNNDNNILYENITIDTIKNQLNILKSINIGYTETITNNDFIIHKKKTEIAPLLAENEQLLAETEPLLTESEPLLTETELLINSDTESDLSDINTVDIEKLHINETDVD